MKKELLQESFAKAKVDSGKDSKHGCCVFLAEKITEQHDYQVSYKTFEHLYDAAVIESRDLPNLKTTLLDKLAAYCGAGDYTSYINSHSQNLPKDPGGLPQKRLNYTAYVLIGLIVVLLIGYPIYQNLEKPKCMVWKEDQYEKAECNGKNTVAFNKRTFKNLKQVEVDKDTRFFDDKNNPQIWYSKNDGEINYFSSHGLDPETGKTLKPITEYMIDKYVKD